MGSYPSLFFPYLSLHCCSNSSLNQANLARIKSWKSCELIPSFTQFTATLKSGMKEELQCQTRAQIQDDLQDNLSGKFSAK